MDKFEKKEFSDQHESKNWFDSFRNELDILKLESTNDINKKREEKEKSNVDTNLEKSLDTLAQDSAKSPLWIPQEVLPSKRNDSNPFVALLQNVKDWLRPADEDIDTLFANLNDTNDGRRPWATAWIKQSYTNVYNYGRNSLS